MQLYNPLIYEMLFHDSCLWNCDRQVFTGIELILTVICSEHCWSPLQYQLSLQWKWKLFVGGSSAGDDFVEVSDIASIATGMRL